MLRAGEIHGSPVRGYAVTPALREWYSSGDMEELEYVAMMHALPGSRCACSPPTPLAAAAAGLCHRCRGRRPADIRPALVSTKLRLLVEISSPVVLRDIVSGLVDDPDAGADLADAIAALPNADAGDEDAQFVVDGADGHELQWYATQELGDLMS